MAGSAVPMAVIADAVAAAKTYLRTTSDDEDALLARIAASAIALGEAYCGIAFAARGFDDVVGVGCGWQRLRAAPVGAIQGVTSLPAVGAPIVLPVEAYGIDIDGEGTGWVRVLAPGAAERVSVSYTAGIAATWDAVPAALAQGVVMLIVHLFTDRASASVPPAAVAALWRPFRRMTLGQEQRQGQGQVKEKGQAQGSYA